jgi:hypothetical protein
MRLRERALAPAALWVILWSCGGDSGPTGGQGGAAGGRAGGATAAGQPGTAGSAGRVPQAGGGGGVAAAGAGGSVSSAGGGGSAPPREDAGVRADAAADAAAHGGDAASASSWFFTARCDACLQKTCGALYGKCAQAAACSAALADASRCFTTGMNTKGGHDIPPGSPDAWGGFCGPYVPQSEQTGRALWSCVANQCACDCLPSYTGGCRP